MTQAAQTNTLAAALKAQFEAAGAVAVEPPILQPAEALLDLYGEDIRARAYVTSDALRGEQMLRPDFTVPVVQMHMAHGAEPARYTYAGTVFRRQEQDAARASEYPQVGYEVFDRKAPASADAEVFARIAGALAHLPVKAITGDMGVLMAAVQGLETSEARKELLLRHIWRPERFRAVLERFSGSQELTEKRRALLEGSVEIDAPVIGKRSAAEIAARIDAMRQDADTPAIADEDVAQIEAVLDLNVALPDAVVALAQIAKKLPSITKAVGQVEARLQALDARGVAVGKLTYDGSYGQRTMEYYDGFVFGFYAAEQHDLPSLASGGRYDALTRRLGDGREIPAVGGVLRPDLMLTLERAL